ncbi:hypothetical protein [Polaromonas sp.]|uniref:hypothetical protein n=1 Tax=Polaromonas sp. TaxID=1869339 RepID=UPI00286CAA83|nr:hypothetical protein [Polaromonas sp.]
MNILRTTGLLGAAGAAMLLSGCVVAPIGPDPYGGYPSASVYVQPGPVVVSPGYYGYRRGYWGHGGYGRGYGPGYGDRHGH